MIIADCGSTWTKIRDLDSGALEIISTKDLVRRRGVVFDVATGHSGKNRCRLYRNELVALAEGGSPSSRRRTFPLSTSAEGT